MTGSRAEGRNAPITVGDQTVDPGGTRRFDLPVARLPTGTWESLPVAVVNGRRPGPNVWLSGAIHGDELNGVEIIRRVLRRLDARRLRGAVLAVPIVNVFGFINESRYLPDRRDLNRSFPGSPRGSLASRLANLFLTQVVEQCQVGIDLHTAAGHRVNVPQVRIDLDDPDTRRLGEAFGAPFVIHARLRDGSLREAATGRGIKVLLYEAGQVRRFDEDAIESGVAGVLRTLSALDMGAWDGLPAPGRPVTLRKTTWVRARRGGIANLEVELGAWVDRGRVLGTISDAFGSRPTRVKATADGWVIARTLYPLVGQGDALVHIGAEGDGTDRLDLPEHPSRARRGPEADRR
ncbi:MAG: succinylglutamate desuccinylase/aspartoacylase family protein [Acidimicrobiia bacterium]